jgi:hypothetical protein
MNIPAWIYDPWFISLATVVITLLAEPLLTLLVINIRSWFGSFSGTYLELTLRQDAKSAVVEIVKCQHIGDRVQGNVKGISFVELRDGKLIELAQNEGKYKLSGNVDERILVLSYYTTNRGAKGSGTMILEADSSGRIFKGVWAGFDEGQVASSVCIWVRINNELSKNRAAVLEEAKKILLIERSLRMSEEAAQPSLKQESNELIGRETGLQELRDTIDNAGIMNNPYLVYIAGEGGLGKTRLLQALMKDTMHANVHSKVNTTSISKKENKSDPRPQSNLDSQKKPKRSRRTHK